MNSAIVQPDHDLARSLDAASSADIQRCYTCGTCDSECPVFQSTERLRPQKIVRLAGFGQLERLIEGAEIWYCLGCQRCLRGCPNLVKPFQVCSHMREEALRRRVVTFDMLDAYRTLFARFQRVRLRAVTHCFRKPLQALSEDQWYRWLKQPIRKAGFHFVETVLDFQLRRPPDPAAEGNRSACFTCGECTNCCPIFGERAVFDPQAIIRMANFGLVGELIRSPSIWLCLGCQRCTETCTQKVSGHTVIEWLKRKAVEKEVVDRFFPERLAAADRIIYPRFLKEIDLLLGLHRPGRPV